MFENFNVGIIGAGRWGINHVKTAASLLPKSNITVCDSNADTKFKLEEISKEINYTDNLNSILENTSIKSVIIATPAETHYDVAKKCILKNKNVLIEKPITLYLDEAKELVELAYKQNVKIMVGHVLLYHPAVLKLKELIEAGKIGKLQYIYSNRLNLGAIRTEENILWSFAPHDISVIQFLIGSNPVFVDAKGDTFLQKNIEDTTITYLKYSNNISAHIFVSWLHPFKEQRLVVIGETGMFVFDDTLKTEKLKYFHKGFKKTETGLEKFDQDYEVVEFANAMPLAEEQKHFYSSIIENFEPRTNGTHAVEVLEILVEATNSLQNKK